MAVGDSEQMQLGNANFSQLLSQLFSLMATSPAPTATLATLSASSSSSAPTASTATISVVSSGTSSDLATRVLHSLLQSAQRLGIPPSTSSHATTRDISTPSALSSETGEFHLRSLLYIPLFFAAQHTVLNNQLHSKLL